MDSLQRKRIRIIQTTFYDRFIGFSDEYHPQAAARPHCSYRVPAALHLPPKACFITQSALSGLIQELEQALGLRLFDRSTRRISLRKWDATSIR